MVILAFNLEEGTILGLSEFLGGEYPGMTLMISSCINSLITLYFSRNSRSLPKFSPPSLDDNSSTINKGNTEGSEDLLQGASSDPSTVNLAFLQGCWVRWEKNLGDVGKFLKGMEEASEFLP